MECKCCNHKMLGNGNSDFCVSCELWLSNSINFQVWIEKDAIKPQQDSKTCQHNNIVGRDYDYQCMDCGKTNPHRS